MTFAHHRAQGQALEYAYARDLGAEDADDNHVLESWPSRRSRTASSSRPTPTSVPCWPASAPPGRR